MSIGEKIDLKIFKKNRKTIGIILSVVVAIVLLVSTILVWQNLRKDQQVTASQVNANREVLAFINTGLKITELRSQRGEAEDLPSALIIKPGRYKAFGQIYDMQEEGLYRFLMPPEGNEQRIVYDNNPHLLLSSISWLFSHGNRDNKMNYDNLEKKARTEKLVATCAKISKFALEAIEEQGINGRIVSGLTNESFNGYDDSHTMIEVRIGSTWRVYDLDNNAVFVSKKTDKYLNFLDFQKLVVTTGAYKIERLASDPIVGVTNFSDKTTDYDYYLYSEEKTTTEESLRDWYEHVLQIPLIQDNNSIYYYADANELKVTEFFKTARKLSSQEMLERFYQ